MICNDDVLDRSVCRVVQNEVIGLRVDPSGLSNFSWMVNGVPLSCTQSGVSPDCVDGTQNEVTFLPVTGNIGDTYTVTLIASDAESGKTVTLARTFNVIEPQVTIVSADENLVWRQLLGQYRDITGQATDCPDGLCNDYSEDILDTYAGDVPVLKAKFIPSFLGASSERAWKLDGQEIGEDQSQQISFAADKPAGSEYNITLSASIAQSDETRRALLDTWGVSPLNSPEVNFSDSAQVQLLDPNLAAAPKGIIQRSFAAIASYLPSSLLFSLRILLSGALILFAASFVMAAVPGERLASRPVKAEEE
ncbi:MAG: hypothetical protein WDN67_02700 [Candidatus Moraniibacteriota bacterium]